MTHSHCHLLSSQCPLHHLILPLQLLDINFLPTKLLVQLLRKEVIVQKVMKDHHWCLFFIIQVRGWLLSLQEAGRYKFLKFEIEKCISRKTSPLFSIRILYYPPMEEAWVKFGQKCMGAFCKTILRSFDGKESKDGLKNVSPERRPHFFPSDFYTTHPLERPETSLVKNAWVHFAKQF